MKSLNFLFLFSFRYIELYFLIAAAIAQIFNPIAELVMFIGIPNKEAKAEMETHQVFEPKIKCSKYVRAVQIQKVFKIS